jgi:phytoene dehydrogenase-like protein
VVNAEPEVAPASLFAEVLRRAFFSSQHAARMGTPHSSLDGMYLEPAIGYLRRHGGRIAYRQPVRQLLVEDGRIAGLILPDGTRLEARAYLAAVPARNLAALLPAVHRGPGGFLAVPAGQPLAPMVSVLLWYDPHPRLPRAFLGLEEGPAEWVFDRGTHLATVTSAAHDLVARPREWIVHEVAASLARQVPALAGRTPVRGVALKERRATPRFTPETEDGRPGPRSPLPNLYLAGDWTDTGLPPTLEGAAESAQRAVDAIMSEVHPARRLPRPNRDRTPTAPPRRRGVSLR